MPGDDSGSQQAGGAKYKDKPIKFIAVGPHDSLTDVKEYIAGTGLVMPTFADPFKVMEKRYGFAISLKNIYQFRVDQCGEGDDRMGHFRMIF